MKFRYKCASDIYRWFSHCKFSTCVYKILRKNGNNVKYLAYSSCVNRSVCCYYSSDNSNTSNYYGVGSKNKDKKNIFIGPGLKQFLVGDTEHGVSSQITAEQIPYLETHSYDGRKRKVFIDVYGCQMNVNDTEIAWSILESAGYLKAHTLEEADVVLVMTCAIRDGAEAKVWNKLDYLKGLKKKRAQKKDAPKMKIGILGCMAERLKERLLDEGGGAVDLVAGPDSYRDLPRMLALTDAGQPAVNVLLSLDETYADVAPVRLNRDSVTAFVSIMRGCDNMCTYCIVPFTRGRERSRPISSIISEVRMLSQQGVKEVTLLGQNVNSYRDASAEDHYGGLPSDEETRLARGFSTVYKRKKGGVRFADLLDHVSRVDPEMRIRFTSPHPKDFPDEVLELVRERPNICRSLHLPAQSGSSAVLARMRRGYSREAYLQLVDRVRCRLPGVALSSDFICGFCGETDGEFQETLSLLRCVRYNVAYLFPYSMREKTTAHRRFVDDVPEEVKKQRLLQMTSLFRNEVEKVNRAKIGSLELVLIEGLSKRSNLHMAGRNDGNTKVILPATEIPESSRSDTIRAIKPGDYVVVMVNEAGSQVLKGIPLYHTTLSEYCTQHDGVVSVKQSAGA
ncbi:CDK5RAP1-like protein [Bacillus rossius redtenbacheri]|uniref:CDK5RAP1-like protein n=1 Tax=Bacillus rossius redtenbacheri TaxID=93214 RepID=UPI002FDEDC3F